MKWTALSVAGLLAFVLAVPGVAQESEKPEAKEGRKVNLTEKYSKDLKITSESDAVSSSEVTLENGMVVQGTDETETEVQITEILEVADDGKVTKLRVRWTESTKVTESSQMGQPGEPVEEEGAHKGASILHTWNAEKKAWENKLEKGDKDADDVKKQLKKKDPLANPMIPNREVKVGESWKADEKALKEFFGNDDAITLSKAESTLKAEEIVKEEDVEYLRVSFEIKLTGNLNDDDIGKPELTMTNKGNYYFNIKESRVELVEMETEGSFSADVEDPAMGKMTLKVAIEGTRVMASEFGKVGDDEDKDDEDEDDGMDG
jgi:hypothetical protein